MLPLSEISVGDSAELLAGVATDTVQCIVTSPPYNLGKEYEREAPLDVFLAEMQPIMQHCYRVLAPGGSIFWQVGNYIKDGAVTPLDMMMWPVFSQLGAILRNRIIWTFGHGLHCKKRFSGRHESILWMTKGDAYTFDLDAVRIPSKYPNKKYFKGPKKGQLSGNPLGKNPGDVWDIPNVKHNHPEKTAHPCQFPEALASRAILCSTGIGDTVLDPFLGSGTTAVAAQKLGRNWIGIERDTGYAAIAQNRIKASSFALAT